MVRNIPYNQSEVIMRTKVEQLLKETELYNQKLIKQNLLEDEKLWSTSDVGQRMDFLYRRRTQKLCSGNVSYFDFKTFSFLTSCNMLLFFEIGTCFCIFTLVLRLSGCLLEILLGSLENLTARQNSNSKLLEKILLEKGSNSILLEKVFARTRSLKICHARFCSVLLDNQSIINDMNKEFTLLL